MKKVSVAMEWLSDLRQGFQNQRIVTGIIGFVLYALLGTNMYSAYIEDYITGYKSSFKNRLLLRAKGNKYSNQ
jgi:hypothetical protein